MPYFHVVSYVFSRSKKTDTRYSCLIEASLINVSNRIRWSIWILWLLKPDWYCVINLLLSRYQISLALIILSTVLHKRNGSVVFCICIFFHKFWHRYKCGLFPYFKECLRYPICYWRFLGGKILRFREVLLGIGNGFYLVQLQYCGPCWGIPLILL